MDILTNKTFKQYSYISRYSNCPIYYHRLDDKYITGTAKDLDKSTLSSDYIIQRGDTLDKLALRYYNNPTLYWIICLFNSINDPFIELEPGTIIKIPVLSNIRFTE